MSSQPFLLRILLKILSLLCDPNLLEDLEGDLTELYFLKRQKHPSLIANWVLFSEFLRMLRPGIIRTPQKVSLIKSSLLNQNIKASIRGIKKAPLISSINIGGLALAFISFFLISIYVLHEFSYDQYHAAYNRIYRVLHHYDYEKKQPSRASKSNLKDFQVWGNAPIGPALKESFSEVEFVGQFTGRHSYLFSVGEARYQESMVHFANTDLLRIFSWKLLEGTQQNLLDEPNTLVLTEDIAKKFFGSKKAIGKTILVDNKTPYKVTGILENIPENSHFTFDILLSMSSLRSERPQFFESWNYVDFYTYFSLAPGKSIAPIEARLSDLNIPDLENASYSLTFEPLSQSYLYSDAKRQPGDTGQLKKLLVFLTAGLLILLVAFINFVNIRIGQTSQRLDELKLRKYLGAQRNDIISHFITDTFIHSILAITIAILFIIVSWPYFENFVQIDFVPTSILNSKHVLLAVSFLLTMVLVSALVPALKLLSFNKVRFQNRKSTGFTSRALLLFQFTVGAILISSTWVISDQLKYLMTRDPGYASDQMLVLDFADDNQVQKNIENIKRAFLSHPHVRSICSSRTLPGNFFPKADTYIEAETGEMQVAALDLFQIDHDFIDHFELELVSGRNYDKNRPKDLSESIVLNEAAARQFGYNDADKIIGKRFEQWGKKGEIVGVVKDFSYQSYHHKINPMTLTLGPTSSFSYLVLQLETTDLQSTLTSVRHIWERHIPQRPFLFQFLDHEVQKSYASEVQVRRVVEVFAVIATILAILGLFGICMILLVSQQKEIAIRKVLGARITSLIAQFSKKYIMLILSGILISVPITQLILERWLDEYAYRVSIQWSSYLWSTIIILSLTILTITSLVARYGISNPADIFNRETR